MRIALYHPRAASGDGGITNSVRRLSAAFARASARATIVCDTDVAPPTTGQGVEWRPVHHHRLGRMRMPTRLDHALEGTDVVILNSAWTLHNVVAGRAARRVRVPYVLAPRGAYDPLIVGRRHIVKRAWWVALEAQLAASSSAIHVFFDSQADHVRSLGYRGQVIVAPNGVMVPDDLRWTGGSGGYLLFLGRFDPEHKGLDLLLHAVATMPPGTLPPMRLQGPDWNGGKRRVERLIRDLGIQDRVQIYDAVHGDAKWTTMADAVGFIYPSRWEGFGNSVAEAAALGVPILATPYPLARFLAERDAAIVAPATVEGLCRGLPRLMDDRAAGMGRRAREAVRKHFTWDKVAECWLEQLRLIR